MIPIALLGLGMESTCVPGYKKITHFALLGSALDSSPSHGLDITNNKVNLSENELCERAYKSTVRRGPGQTKK